METDPEYMTNVLVRVGDGDRVNLTCKVLRMMARDAGSDVTGATNDRLRTGYIFRFGAGPTARGFMADVKALLRKPIRTSVTLQLLG